MKLDGFIGAPFIKIVAKINERKYLRMTKIEQCSVSEMKMGASFLFPSEKRKKSWFLNRYFASIIVIIHLLLLLDC